MSIHPAAHLRSVNEYYFSKKLREIDELKKQGNKIINLGIGSPDLPPSPEVINTLQKEAEIPSIHGYQSYRGIPELREAYSNWYATKYGVQLNPNTEVLPLMGSKEGIMHISMAFLDEGDEVLIPNPGYPTYSSVTKMLKAQPIFYNLKKENGWEPDFNEIYDKISSKTKIIWLNFPHMPTGKNGNDRIFNSFLEIALRFNILLVNDNPYSFILNKNPLSIFQFFGADKVALELNSLSKSHNMAGWRVGMLAGNSELIAHVLKVKSNFDSGMFYPIQQAAVRALQLDESWYQQINEIYQNRKSKLINFAQSIGCVPYEHGTGMFLWCKIPQSALSDKDFSDTILHKHHVFITPGSIFGSNGEGFIRISLSVNDFLIDECLLRTKQTIEVL